MAGLCVGELVGRAALERDLESARENAQQVGRGLATGLDLMLRAWRAIEVSQQESRGAEFASSELTLVAGMETAWRRGQ